LGENHFFPDHSRPENSENHLLRVPSWPKLHSLTKLIHVFLIRQNPGAGVIKIQVGLPGLSIPVLFDLQDCFDRLGWLISIRPIFWISNPLDYCSKISDEDLLD